MDTRTNGDLAVAELAANTDGQLGTEASLESTDAMVGEDGVEIAGVPAVLMYLKRLYGAAQGAADAGENLRDSFDFYMDYQMDTGELWSYQALMAGQIAGSIVNPGLWTQNRIAIGYEAWAEFHDIDDGHPDHNWDNVYTDLRPAHSFISAAEFVQNNREAAMEIYQDTITFGQPIVEEMQDYLAENPEDYLGAFVHGVETVVRELRSRGEIDEATSEQMIANARAIQDPDAEATTEIVSASDITGFLASVEGEIGETIVAPDGTEIATADAVDHFERLLKTDEPVEVALNDGMSTDEKVATLVAAGMNTPDRSEDLVAEEEYDYSV